MGRERPKPQPTHAEHFTHQLHGFLLSLLGEVMRESMARCASHRSEIPVISKSLGFHSLPKMTAEQRQTGLCGRTRFCSRSRDNSRCYLSFHPSIRRRLRVLFLVSPLECSRGRFRSVKCSTWRPSHQRLPAWTGLRDSSLPRRLRSSPCPLLSLFHLFSIVSSFSLHPSLKSLFPFWDAG